MTAKSDILKCKYTRSRIIFDEFNRMVFTDFHKLNMVTNGIEATASFPTEQSLQPSSLMQNDLIPLRLVVIWTCSRAARLVICFATASKYESNQIESYRYEFISLFLQ